MLSKRIFPCLLFLLLLLLMVFATACAPVTFNRYQTADTMGKGQKKLMAAVNMAPDLAFPVVLDLESEMQDKAIEWGNSHPGNDGEIAEATAEDIGEDFLWIIFTGGGQALDTELLFAYGVHDRIDLELRLTATLYARANVKILLTELGDRGALSIGPGFGYRSFSNRTDDEGDVRDEYDGNIIAMELPLIIGGEFGSLSPYLGLGYNYYKMSGEFTRRLTDTTPEFKGTLDLDFNIHMLIAYVGMQIKFAEFIMTPELTFNYTTVSDLEYDVGSIYPGLALGGQW